MMGYVAHVNDREGSPAICEGYIAGDHNNSSDVEAHNLNCKTYMDQHGC